jgi:dipeptidase D
VSHADGSAIVMATGHRGNAVDRFVRFTVGLLATSVLGAVGCTPSAEVPSVASREIAEYADSAYFEATLAALADLIAFRTVHLDGVENASNPEFRAQTAYLEGKAAELGLDLADYGEVVVIGLGQSGRRLGLVTHGDVQPADPTKWVQDPFTLDTSSEPGRLVGRGSEDDKGPIATALYAMAAVQDRGIPLRRRIELIISYTEESNWQPFFAFLQQNPPPDLNVALDSEYPVVVAEKGWNSIHLSIPPVPGEPAGTNRLVAFGGGAFLSQIPEDAEAVIADPTAEVEALLREAGARDSAVSHSFTSEGGTLTIRSRGLAAHSSKPEDGRNAITHLAALLGAHTWPDGQAARMVRLINDLVGTGDYAERFGVVAFSDPFMGPLTLSLTTLGVVDGGLVAGINIRSPVGRSQEELEQSMRDAVAQWQARSGVADVEIRVFTSQPYHLRRAPHIPVLLDIFEHFTGQPDPQPISIGGGTHARVMPNGLNFGPTMPGDEYTGHTEHEFISREQMRLNLKMYTAMLVELAGE